MISRITGIVVEKSAAYTVIDVGGVGYQAHLPTPDLAGLPKTGERVTLNTYLHVREDALQLYGFENPARRDLFVQLIGVSGVGPKVALTILSHFTSDDLSRAVLREDVDMIATVPGIGKKGAQRLVLELKGKLETSAAEVAQPSSSALTQAREALIGLGYTTEEALAALKGLPHDGSAEECVKAALKNLTAGRA